MEIRILRLGPRKHSFSKNDYKKTQNTTLQLMIVKTRRTNTTESISHQNTQINIAFKLVITHAFRLMCQIKSKRNAKVPNTRSILPRSWQRRRSPRGAGRAGGVGGVDGARGAGGAGGAGGARGARGASVSGKP